MRDIAEIIKDDRNGKKLSQTERQIAVAYVQGKYDAVRELKIDNASNTNEVLDKIRAEILEEKECAYADFERYKVEYLGQDPEDVLDSLPQDDFRYGMERAIEIIDKYKAESEG